MLVIFLFKLSQWHSQYAYKRIYTAEETCIECAKIFSKLIIIQVYNIVGYAKHKIIVKVHLRNIKRRGRGVLRRKRKKKRQGKNPL